MPTDLVCWMTADLNSGKTEGMEEWGRTERGRVEGGWREDREGEGGGRTEGGKRDVYK